MTQVTLLTGPERRRRWSEEERAAILTAAFAPGAVVTDVARQFEISTGLIYQWWQNRNGAVSGFAPMVVADAPVPSSSRTQSAAIVVELGQARVSIASSAPAGLVSAILRALK